jgi:hypothetical protein
MINLMPLAARQGCFLITSAGATRLMASGSSRRNLCHVRHKAILLANQRKTRREPKSAPRKLLPRVPQVPT